MATDWLGQTIGNCRIEEKIGEGGCGQVFRGVDLMLDRSVAIKVLHPKLAGRLDVTERFRREAHAMARLSHPNVATLYSFHREENNYLMVMEYVEGDTFEALLKKRGPMPPALAIPLIRQALAGVGHAHREGILHRDLKATNLMLNGSGVVKVMDFGIARALGSVEIDSDALTNQTQGGPRPSVAVPIAGNPIGTPEYMSPEQARGETLDPRADVYALGVLLFKLLTGRLPIRGDTPADVMRAQIERAPRPIRVLAPEVPEAVAQAVDRAMEKSIDRRFEDAEAFRETLGVTLVGDDATSAALPAPTNEAKETATPEAEIESVIEDPDSELGPTQVMSDPPPATKLPPRHQVLLATGALVAFVCVGIWLGQSGRVGANPGAAKAAIQTLSDYRLPPFNPRAPVGFDVWPVDATNTGSEAGTLGPEDFGVIPEALSLSTQIGTRTEADSQPPPTEEPAIAQPKKEQARGAAKAQNRTRRAARRKSVPATRKRTSPSSDEVPAAQSEGRTCGWVIRR